MQNSINRAFSSVSALAFAAADMPNAAQPVPTAATVAAITKPETEAVKAKSAKLAAKRKQAKPTADKPVSAKPGKRKPAKPAIEAAKPDPRAARSERIAADRSSVSELYSAFEANRVSVPVKPLSAFKPQPSHAHAIARQPSIRQAAAIAAAFAAAGTKLKPGATASRVFEYNGARVCIENGAIADAISSGLITVSGDSPETEKLRLAAKADVKIVGFLGEKLCRKAGIA